ncbi:hypothetical protein N7462_005541 [Penicillium macrosclerotiorum]|uniref:uncharacterized protein n=1 Tax=Penicillium macrosclerotiorum TaxID=303699 RepID=UPI002546F069|nr:uncharacterized protein N7462_005541 [Penicillium macrosclerotiorum]KAJ5682376.1 hypothetical protein N7462_005541 [Penicillium macrosclerotiorum]
MQFSLSVALLAVTSLASPALRPRQTSKSACTDPVTRIEWDGLTNAQQQNYLKAERCLWDRPAQTHLRADGPFLRWHRYFVHVHESLLRTECNYTGPTPWWDERKHAGAFRTASISPDTFGSAVGTYYNVSLFDQDEDDYVCIKDGA